MRPRPNADSDAEIAYDDTPSKSFGALPYTAPHRRLSGPIFPPKSESRGISGRIPSVKESIGDRSRFGSSPTGFDPPSHLRRLALAVRARAPQTRPEAERTIRAPYERTTRPTSNPTYEHPERRTARPPKRSGCCHLRIGALGSTPGRIEIRHRKFVNALRCPS